MKIAILTLPLHTNYGGILQCYALQTVLERMGHEVYVLEKKRYTQTLLFKFLMVCKRLLKKYLLGDNIMLFPSHEYIYQCVNKFIRKYINILYKRKWNSKTLGNFDVFVVGSDQIWRPEYFSPIENAFLAFAKDMCIKRIAYSASFGTDQCVYSSEQLAVCSDLLSKFDAVSVREDSGIRICHEFFGVQAEQMLDPTLLLEADDYRKLVSKVKTEPIKGNMLVYILDATEEKRKLVNEIAEDKGLTPFWLDNVIDICDASLKKSTLIPVEQWIRAFDASSFIVTDSFHGCVFSIIFKKNFVVIGNANRGMVRFTSLLNMFSLMERLVSSLEEYRRKKQMLKMDIKYSSVYKKLAQERVRAFRFIEKNLA